MCTLDQWGPAAWRTLHCFAHTAPRVLDDAAQHEMRLFLRLFAARLPCPACRRHFAAYLDAHLDAAGAVATRESVVHLVHEAHNAVNARTGKRLWTLEEHYAAYRRRPGWDHGAVLAAVVLAAAGCAAIISLRRGRNHPFVHRCPAATCLPPAASDSLWPSTAATAGDRPRSIHHLSHGW